MENKAKEFLDNYDGKMLTEECNFAPRQIALFMRLARDWGIDPEDVPAALIELALKRLKQIENIDTISTLN